MRCALAGAKITVMALRDNVPIKDNHIVAAGGTKPAVELARRHSHHLLKIEVEVETLEQVEEALEAGAEVIMLDNMSPALLAEGVKRIGKRALVEFWRSEFGDRHSRCPHGSRADFRGEIDAFSPRR
jgi:nicotinate-nucleotide pyrophosphorylase